MCQAKPGNRCSSHARESLTRAHEDLKLAEESGSSSALAEATQKYRTAVFEFQTTPLGQKALASKIEESNLRGDDEAVSRLSAQKEAAAIVQERRILAQQKTDAITLEVKIIADMKSREDYARGEEEAQPHDSLIDGAPTDEFISEHQQSVKDKQTTFNYEVTRLRAELSEKVDKGTAKSSDYRRFRQALVRSARFANVAAGARAGVEAYRKQVV